MMQTLTIARRELTALFFSPIAYVVMGLFAIAVIGPFVMMMLAPGDPATCYSLFGYAVATILLLIAPAISMRLLSEEFGRGTIETLMTAPVSDTQVVLGKYFGALAFLAITFAWLIVPIGVLEYFGDPDYGPIVSGIFGLLLLGGLYLSIGLFASSLTGNQIIAYILTLFLMAPLIMVDVAGALIARLDVGENLRRSIYYLSVHAQFDAFNQGVFTLAGIIYFLSGIALFLFLAVKVVESRRWR